MASSSGESRAGYWEWTFSGESTSHRYIVPGVLKALGNLRPRRVLDIGCGNGALTARVAEAGYEMTGIDFTATGIERARASFPGVQFHPHDISDPLPEEMQGRFDAVLSAEVIEHLFLPRDLLARAREALGPSGHAVITTPYHGYWKNLSLAVLDKFDHHWSPQSDYGHVKFFSERTLSDLLGECGFDPMGVLRVGHIPPLAASMIMTGRLRPP
jgi:2-polyprenyl-6-hydroxyphenyl methylase/3-demethylubiquinone-9 3-methyltransferase